MAYLFSAAALLVSVISFFYLRGYVKKRTAIDRIPAETREAVDIIIGDIDRITDRDSLLIEERVRVLKEIMAQAEQLSVAGCRLPVGSVCNTNSNEDSNTNTDISNKKPGTNNRKPTTGKKPETGNQQPETGPPPTLPSVMQLAELGVPVAAIAERLGKTPHEVELELFVQRASA
ncbi:MAG: hypothetical protein LBG72_02755 [Spirochaetaceae bacterium]|jgi:hypothetical protein|nr:hypothetical protein [Spirochaetaceae bacterium]